MKSKFRIKSGDQVVVIAGRDKGKSGKVMKLLPKTDRILIEGVNVAKRHSKPSQKDPQGGVVEKTLPVHISNVLLMDPKTQKGTRVGRRLVEGKKGAASTWERISRKSGTVFA